LRNLESDKSAQKNASDRAVCFDDTLEYPEDPAPTLRTKPRRLCRWETGSVQVPGLVGIDHCRRLVSGFRGRTTHSSLFVTVKIGGIGLELPASYLMRRLESRGTDGDHPSTRWVRLESVDL